jgi:hypothetical protein
MMYGLDDKDNSIEDVAHRVHLAISEHCTGDCRTIFASLDACARDAVAALWASPVKTYVPLLAYRQVRECIRQGSCPSGHEEPLS